MDTTFIYALVDPRDGRVRYVGKTNNPTRRVQQHMANRNTKHNKEYGKWLCGLRDNKLKPSLIVLDEAPCDTWQKRERSWIADLRQCGFPLLNLHDGGWGGNGVSEAQKRAVSRALKGRKMPQRQRDLISRSLKNRTISDEHKGNMRKNHWSTKGITASNRLSNEQLFERLQKKASKLGRSPYTTEMDKGYAVIMRRFGTWNAALVAAGLDPIDPSTRAKYRVRNRQYAGEANAHAKLLSSDVITIRQRYEAGETLKRIASDYPVGFTMISNIVRRKAWTNI